MLSKEASCKQGCLAFLFLCLFLCSYITHTYKRARACRHIKHLLHLNPDQCISVLSLSHALCFFLKRNTSKCAHILHSFTYPNTYLHTKNHLCPPPLRPQARRPTNFHVEGGITHFCTGGRLQTETRQPKKFRGDGGRNFEREEPSRKSGRKPDREKPEEGYRAFII